MEQHTWKRDLVASVERVAQLTVNLLMEAWLRFDIDMGKSNTYHACCTNSQVHLAVRSSRASDRSSSQTLYSASTPFFRLNTLMRLISSSAPLTSSRSSQTRIITSTRSSSVGAKTHTASRLISTRYGRHLCYRSRRALHLSRSHRHEKSNIITPPQHIRVYQMSTCIKLLDDVG